MKELSLQELLLPPPMAHPPEEGTFIPVLYQGRNRWRVPHLHCIPRLSRNFTAVCFGVSILEGKTIDSFSLADAILFDVYLVYFDTIPWVAVVFNILGPIMKVKGREIFSLNVDF